MKERCTIGPPTVQQSNATAVATQITTFFNESGAFGKVQESLRSAGDVEAIRPQDSPMYSESDGTSYKKMQASNVLNVDHSNPCFVFIERLIHGCTSKSQAKAFAP